MAVKDDRLFDGGCSDFQGGQSEIGIENVVVVRVTAGRIGGKGYWGRTSNTAGLLDDKTTNRDASCLGRLEVGVRVRASAGGGAIVYGTRQCDAEWVDEHVVFESGGTLLAVIAHADRQGVTRNARARNRKSASRVKEIKFRRRDGRGGTGTRLTSRGTIRGADDPPLTVLAVSGVRRCEGRSYSGPRLG